MKTKLIPAVIVIALIAIVYMSCGLSINSESSCESALCKGFWSYEYNAEPMISKYGNFIFKNNGICQYCTIGGINGNQTNGTWQLGDVVNVTKKLSYRIVNVSMDSDINEGGAGKNFVIELWGGDGKSYLGIKNESAQYFHFNDDSKPIN